MLILVDAEPQARHRSPLPAQPPTAVCGYLARSRLQPSAVGCPACHSDRSMPLAGPLRVASLRTVLPCRDALANMGRAVTFAAISLPCRDTRSLRSWRYAAPDAFRGFGDWRKRAPPMLGPSWSPGMVLKWCDRNALSCACGNAGKICQCCRRDPCPSGHPTVHGPKLMSSRTVTRPLSQRISTRSSALRTGLAISRVGGYVGMHPGQLLSASD